MPYREIVFCESEHFCAFKSNFMVTYNSAALNYADEETVISVPVITPKLNG